MSSAFPPSSNKHTPPQKNHTKKFSDYLPNDAKSPSCPRTEAEQMLPSCLLAVGVTHDDMPDTPKVFTHYMRSLVDLPVVRKLVWRKDPSGRPIRQDLKDSMSVRTAFLQTRGKEPPQPCSSCAANRGPWETCVVPDSEASYQRPICANCLFGRFACSFPPPETTSAEKKLGQDQSVDTVDDILKHNVSPTDLFQDTSSAMFSGTRDDAWVTDDEDKNNTEANGLTAFHGVSEASASKKRKTISLIPGSASIEHKGSRFDGKVIAFPLGPEAIDDLALLKQAVKDMTMHLAVVKRRVNQLQDQKLQKDKEINPWDLV